MSTGIKTCVKCGAKNFLEFKTCFNCGGTDFVTGKDPADRETGVNKKAPVGLQHVTLREEMPPERKSAPAVREAERPRILQAAPIEGKAKTPGEAERRTIFDNKREIVREKAVASEPVKRDIKRPIPQVNEPEHTASKLNMQAQQERLRREEERRKQAAEKDEILLKIADKLDKLEAKIEKPIPVTVAAAGGEGTELLRQTVTGNMEKLDQAIGELKSDNKEFMETVLSAQQAQIEKLEAEKREYTEKLQRLAEEKGRDGETLDYLDSENQRLEQQLEVERSRFEMLLKDREQIKQLTENRAAELPGDCVVFTGDNTDPDYLEYAKRQFLKIYPKIESGENGEDVIYYIPGEFKNPPVLVLNPDIAKDYKRNFKINMVSTAPAPEAIEAAPPVRIAEPAAPAMPRQEQAAEEVKGKPEPESVGEVAAMESLSEILSRIERAPEVTAVKTQQAMEQTAPEPEKEAVWTEQAEERKAEQAQAAPQPVIAGVINSAVVAGNSIRDIAEITARQHKSRKRLAVTCILIGILAILSVGALALDYVGSVKGYDMIAANLSLFQKSYANEFVLLQNMAAGAWASIAKYVCLFGLLATLATVAAGVLCFVKSEKTGGAKIVRLAVMIATLLLDVFLIVAVPMVFGAKNIFTAVGMGLWLKVVLDIAVIVLTVLFMKERAEVQRIAEPQKPLDIVDKREIVPSIQLDESMQKVRNEIAGK